MIKHIAGLILFSLIVGVSVLFSAVTGVSNVSVTDAVVIKGDSDVPVKDVREYRFEKKKRKKRKRRHCRHHEARVRSVQIEKAVFDGRTGLFSVALDSELNGLEENLDLHFYANDQFGPRYLKTERFSNSTQTAELFRELRWMKFMDKDQKVFVIAGRSDRWNDETIPPGFDLSKAIPVQMER